MISTNHLDIRKCHIQYATIGMSKNITKTTAQRDRLCLCSKLSDRLFHELRLTPGKIAVIATQAQNGL
jgi:hypothetical protein